MKFTKEEQRALRSVADDLGALMLFLGSARRMAESTPSQRWRQRRVLVGALAMRLRQLRNEEREALPPRPSRKAEGWVDQLTTAVDMLEDFARG